MKIPGCQPHMSCPVCDSSTFTEISGGWRDRKVARCDECGVMYDHLFVTGDIEESSSAKVNCPECGSLNAGDRDSCSYCDAPLNESTG
jgi:uncharacterized Zn finger protein